MSCDLQISSSALCGKPCRMHYQRQCKPKYRCKALCHWNLEQGRSEPLSVWQSGVWVWVKILLFQGKELLMFQNSKTVRTISCCYLEGAVWGCPLPVPTRRRSCKERHGWVRLVWKNLIPLYRVLISAQQKTFEMSWSGPCQPGLPIRHQCLTLQMYLKCALRRERVWLYNLFSI